MKIGSVALSAALCLCFGASLRAEELKTFELSTAASSADISKAREALEGGSVVYMRLVDLRQFNAYLAVQAPLRKSSTLVEGDPGERSCLAAAYLGRGSVATFVGPEVVGGHRPERDPCEIAFKQWLAKQNLLRSTPDASTWTAQGASSRSFGQFSTDVSIYRATSDDQNNAYYLYTVEMTDQTASSSVKSCTINLQGLQSQNQPAPVVLDYGGITSSPGTPSLIGGTIPSTATITPYQPDNWSGNQSMISYPGTLQTATWMQQYSAGEGSTEVRVAAAIFQVSRPSLVSIDVTTNCTDGTNLSSQSDVTYITAPPDLVVPPDVYVVAGSSVTFSATVTPSRNHSFDWSPSLSNSNVNLTQSGNSITISALNSPSGATTSISYHIDPPWATTTIVPTTSVHVIATPPQSGVLLAGGYGVNNEPLATADVWNANTGQVTPTNNPMTTTRWRHTATSLDATHILITGGYGGANGAAQASTEIYDVTSGLFTAGPNMNSARAGHTATVLTGPVSKKQYVVLAGGVDQNGNAVGTLDVYDVAAGAFLPSPAMVTARWNHSAVAPTNQQIVIAGGSQSENSNAAALSATEVCTINSADNISCGGAPGLQTGRQGHTMVVFDSKAGQEVYVFGGFNATATDPLGCSNPLCSWEFSGAPGQFFYDRYYSAFTGYLPLQLGRSYPAVLTLPPNPKLPIVEPRFLFIGGYKAAQQIQSCTLVTFLDCDAPEFGNTASLTTVRAYPVALTLGFTGSAFDNQVLIAGGVDLNAVPASDDGTEIEIYDPVQNKIAVSGNMSSPRTFLTGTAFQVPPAIGAGK